VPEVVRDIAERRQFQSIGDLDKDVASPKESE
jgi:hypothetical protein